MVGNVTDAITPEPFDEDSYYQDPAGFFARLEAEVAPLAPCSPASRKYPLRSPSRNSAGVPTV